jgi:hypothetical protein
MNSDLERLSKRQIARKFVPFHSRHDCGGSLFLRSYDGDFTLSIQNGIPIKIPNSELVVPWTDINDDTGLRTEVNSSLANLIINPLDYEWGDGGHLPIMGRLFFSTAYLSVNHDAGTFTIWSAEDSFSSGTPSIKALSPENAIVEDFCDGTGNDESPIQESPGSTDTPSPQQEQKSKLSGGAIGGIVLGGLAFVAAILALILFLLRKKKAKAKPMRATSMRRGTLPCRHITVALISMFPPKCQHQLLRRQLHRRPRSTHTGNWTVTANLKSWMQHTVEPFNRYTFWLPHIYNVFLGQAIFSLSSCFIFVSVSIVRSK